jgi:predicted alpha/beta-hydrolase family hydrolase
VTDIKMSLSAIPQEEGFEMLAINAGIAKGHDIEFTPEVLKESVALWNNVPCMLDHPGLFQGPSVRDLAGTLHDPAWDDENQGIKARLSPVGPAAEVLQALRQAAKSNPAIMEAVGFSAVLNISANSGNKVTRIHHVASVDCVVNPARGGKFLQGRVQDPPQQNNQGEKQMEENEETKPTEEQQDKETQSLLAAQSAIKKQEVKNASVAESMRQVRLQTCRDLLKVSLEAAHLPGPSAQRVQAAFEKRLDKGEPFEPQELELAIQDEQSLISQLTAAGAIQGPGRVTSMVNTADALEVAVDNLFGVPHEAKLANVKAAHLTGLRELYMMLTGDYDLHGGFYGERIQLATTSDFSGLVKNALNKVVAQNWDAVGRAGYDWWQKIATVEHFNSLNTITGILVGTVGSLPSVSEGAEYTELAIGDSPETADFTKYGGYIPLTLELIDRDDTRRLKAYAAELGNAAIRKISALEAAVFTANAGIGPTMADGGALFNNTAVTTLTGHANLLTTAIGADYTAWNAIALAMFNQPMLIKNAAGYYGTGPKMAIWPRFCLVPGALKADAEALFVPRWASQLNSPATTKGAVSWGGQVEVVTVPDWTDATDYAAVMDPAVAPAIIVGERFGLKPEIYTAGRETDPAVFMNDEHRIKVRMFNAILVQDFRPLHKENVGG